MLRTRRDFRAKCRWGVMTSSSTSVMDDEKFEQIVSEHSSFVYNVAYRMMGDPDDADEVVQDTFLSAYRARDRFRGDAQVTTWLYRIATNAALMRLRKNSRKKEISTDPTELYRRIDRADWADAPDRTALNNELSEQIQGAIETLPDDLKVAVILRDVEGLTNDEAAQVLEVSISALKARLHRGRVILRNILADYVNQRSS